MTVPVPFTVPVRVSVLIVSVGMRIRHLLRHF